MVLSVYQIFLFILVFTLSFRFLNIAFLKEEAKASSVFLV